ncbi:MAG TPA: 5-(carboxyamino)imidazole ribonucleotide synthase [Rhizomicrobium sp.]|nr:5-(carboxyamino)imidazole ribonucleotide synthase [Rhizomicrobium sp.]
MSDIKRLTAPVAPGGTIGILGGGQLGRMLALAAARLGLKTHIYCDEADAPAFQVSQAHTHAAYDDKAALAKFAAACDAITFEFENIPEATVSHLAALKPVNPHARALEPLQDRFAEKSFVTSLGLKTAPFFQVNDAEEARAAFARLGGRGVMKTRRFGYDGKGQAKVSSPDEAARAVETLKGAPAILEGFVDFAFEASVIAARGIDGAFAAYDPPENLHEHHILRRSIVPGRLTTAQTEDAKAVAKQIGKALDYVGVFCVELFVTKDGALLVNEIAPRVHNSGHWTLEACLTSQFEQHIRAVAGWPLGSPERNSDAVMENIIGREAADWRRLAANGGALHLYGKSEIRDGRKMGHVTWLKPRSGGG